MHMVAAGSRFPRLSCQFPDKIAHFGKNHTFAQVLFFTGGQKSSHCYAERFLRAGIGLAALFLGQFGSSQRSRVAKCELQTSVLHSK